MWAHSWNSDCNLVRRGEEPAKTLLKAPILEIQILYTSIYGYITVVYRIYLQQNIDVFWNTFMWPDVFNHFCHG